MSKYVVALCLPENSTEIDNAKVIDMVKNAFVKDGRTIKDIVILDFNNMSQSTRDKLIKQGSVDCLILEADTIIEESGKDVVVKAITVENESGKGTQFVGVYDGKNEENVQKTCDLANRLSELVADGIININLLDVNTDPRIISKNLQGMYAKEMKIRKILKNKDEEVKDFAMEVVDSIEKDTDEYTSRHIRSVCKISEEIAKKMGMSRDEIDLVKIGALLHDIGKQQVTNQYLTKKEKLSDNEFLDLKQHVVLGEIELDQYDMGKYERAKTAAAQHHERYDGKGYPRGLKGEEIDIISRIVSAADAAQAMFGRDYQEHKKTKNELVAEILKCSGTQFDPTVGKILADILEKEPESINVTYDEQGHIQYSAPTSEQLLEKFANRREKEGEEFLSKMPEEKVENSIESLADLVNDTTAQDIKFLENGAQTLIGNGKYQHTLTSEEKTQ